MTCRQRDRADDSGQISPNLRPMDVFVSVFDQARCPSHKLASWTCSRYHNSLHSLPITLLHPSSTTRTKLTPPIPQVQCRIFSSTYNPQRLRTGNRVLRQRLRGPSVASYYPRRVATIKDLQEAYKTFDEELETWDDDEEDRLEHLVLAKQRGKGAPKKKRTAEGMRLPVLFLERVSMGFGRDC